MFGVPKFEGRLNQKGEIRIKVKKLVLSMLGFGAIASLAFAGSETYGGKEMKQMAAPLPCPEWYADREFNVSLWGTYVFTGNEWANDRYIEADHAWGGGGDIKYFFARYFGIGIEGWVVDARQAHEDVFIDFSEGIFDHSIQHQNNAIGAVLGTLTLRYPFHCSRFSPYIFGGGGAIFGGGQRTDFVLTTDIEEGEPHDQIVTRRTDSTTEAIGQVGGGLEIRLTPHIGWISDFSWNFINGPDNNFGMARTGVNFAF
jgi:hypothetical protein